jgi:hypothetical protein
MITKLTTNVNEWRDKQKRKKDEARRQRLDKKNMTAEQRMMDDK